MHPPLRSLRVGVHNTNRIILLCCESGSSEVCMLMLLLNVHKICRWLVGGAPEIAEQPNRRPQSTDVRATWRSEHQNICRKCHRQFAQHIPNVFVPRSLLITIYILLQRLREGTIQQRVRLHVVTTLLHDIKHPLPMVDQSCNDRQEKENYQEGMRVRSQNTGDIDP